MELQQILEMLVELKPGQDCLKASQDKMDGRQEEMKAQMASLASGIWDNKEKFEVLQGTLVL
jgi:hypothetical protein